jgi:DNA-binding NarL/FixJ family response regulator
MIRRDRRGVVTDVSVEPVRVLVADDHPVYRDGLVRLLDEMEGLEVVGAAEDGEQAVALAEELAPDVVVMDLRMPRLDGIEATRRIARAHPHVGIVVLSMFDDDELVLAALRAGARGYLLKDADDVQIASVVRGIARGEAIFGPGTAQRLLDVMVRSPQPLAPVEARFPQLTGREREVLELLAEGRRNTEIASALFLSERTVRNYVSNIFAKLHVSDRAQAVATARDAGIGTKPAVPHE